ncbi:MAG TPA: hypothetical protein VEG64_05680, partial [Candidatus Sulfotelmatobacter sp.]|nr:hypothetical protein [Candidatus Sulfotelmatobacter sp.]
MLHIRHARESVGQLREIGYSARGFEFAACSELIHQQDSINTLLTHIQPDHALENSAMLLQEKILCADFLDRNTESTIIENDGAEDAALRLYVM